MGKTNCTMFSLMSQWCTILFGVFMFSTCFELVNGIDGTVEQLSYCSANIGGKHINLNPIQPTRESGQGPLLAGQLGEHPHVWNYTYSPCVKFTKPDNPDDGFGDKCLAVAICKSGDQAMRQYFYTLGFVQNAKFIVTNDQANNTNISLVYEGYRSMKGKKSKINLVCDRSRISPEEALFTVIKDDRRLGDVVAELHHLCCCPDGCPDTGSSYYGNGTQNDDVPEQKDNKVETDRTKVMIIVGVNLGIILMAGLVGFLCYSKRPHFEIYHKLPGRAAPEASLWQIGSTDIEGFGSGPISSTSMPGPSTADKSGYRDGEPARRRKSLCFPVLEHCNIPEECLKMGQRLGGGIFGDTYIGEWTGVTVSIKRITLSVHKYQLSREYIQELQEQVTFLSSQRHRNIVSSLGFCTEPKHPYVISEFIQGQVVKDLIKHAGGQLTWPHRVKILSQVADGMAFLHSTQPPILHRDLRCGNLFITNNDVVKVCDFGIVKLTQRLRADCQDQDCCCQGLYSACPPAIGWTAPEVLEHPNSLETDGHITTASDVYSYSIIMWELVMCEDPYDDMTTAQEVMEYVISGGRPDLPTSNELLSPYIDLMKICWDSDTEQRNNFKQITAKLKGILHQAKLFQKMLNSKTTRNRTTSKSVSFSEDTVITPEVQS